MEKRDLIQSPFTVIHPQGIRGVFSPSEINEILELTDKVCILDRKEFTGSIIENIEEALLYLRKHLQLRWEITNESTGHKEILELPEPA